MSRRVRRRALHPLWANLKLKSATRFPSLFCSIQYSTWHTNSHRKYRTCLGWPPIKGHSKVTEAFMFGEVELQAYNADTNSTRISWRDRESTLITERIKIPASKIQLLEKSHWHNYTQILARTKIFFTLRNLSTEFFFLAANSKCTELERKWESDRRQRKKVCRNRWEQFIIPVTVSMARELIATEAY